MLTDIPTNKNIYGMDANWSEESPPKNSDFYLKKDPRKTRFLLND